MNKMKPYLPINIFLRSFCLVSLAASYLFFPGLTYAQERMPIKVLRLQFFPLVNGRLDPTKTGMNITYDEIVAKTNSMTATVEQALEEGSKYRGYKNTTSLPYLDYQIIDTKEYLTAIPRSNNQTSNPGWYRPDYQQILSNVNICDYVENQGVKQVWMWGYQYGDIEPAESNMAGPNGDISNTNRINDMPICQKTYVLYNYNYTRESEKAVHNHMHQLEFVLSYLDYTFFWDRWARPYGSTSAVNNCGWTHSPPNTSTSYDYVNASTVQTRCEDWNPDWTGPIRTANCSLWGCTEIGFYRWWLQNIPGKNNNHTYQGLPLRNWWDTTYDFDEYLKGGKSLFVAPDVGYDNINPVVNTIQPYVNSRVSGVTRIITVATDNIGVVSHKILIDNFKPNSGTKELKECGAVNSCTYDLNIETMELLPDAKPNHFVIVVEARDAQGNLGRKFIEVEAVRGITPTPTLKPGDVNGDNLVNLSDLSTLLSFFGKPGTRSQGDISGNGTINIQDLATILSNFGK